MTTKGISNISAREIPNCDDIIGSPPCQSWSRAGSSKGIHDELGKFIYGLIRVVKAKQLTFFVMENVSGLFQKNIAQLLKIFVVLSNI